MRLRLAVQSSRLPEARDTDRGKVDCAGRHVRQIELCPMHYEVVIERELGGVLRFPTDATNSVRQKRNGPAE
jgi:hypothetical protein